MGMLRLKGPFGERFVEVIGGRMEIRGVEKLIEELGEIDARFGTTTQIFDASRVAGKLHLFHSARLALIAHSAGRNITNSLTIELLCWAAGTDQIDQALERVGVRKNTGSVALLVLGKNEEGVSGAIKEALENLKIKREDKVLGINPEKTSKLAEVFSISERELETSDIQKLVLERMALLATRH